MLVDNIHIKKYQSAYSEHCLWCCIL